MSARTRDDLQGQSGHVQRTACGSTNVREHVSRTSHGLVPASATPEELAAAFEQVRGFSRDVVSTLATEDFVIQSMPDVSPTRWHLAHTTWFFETFLLSHECADYKSFHPEFEFLFNSYYNAVGQQYPRSRRGLLSRPTVEDVFAYRERVDDWVLKWLEGTNRDSDAAALEVLELGLHHEQQHQELILTDIKHVFWCNPLFPAMFEQPLSPAPTAAKLRWMEQDEQLVSIGYEGEGFHFDNEGPHHATFIQSHQLACRLVTNGEYLKFVQAGGYQDPQWWLSLGWATVQSEGWQAPLYWVCRDEQWFEFTLAGLVPLDLNRPVCHVSYFEAEAFARFCGARLPTEAEWELAAREQPVAGNFVADGVPHPRSCPQLEPSAESDGNSSSQAVKQRGATSGSTSTAESNTELLANEPQPRQMYGDVWEWTASPYVPYPGYVTTADALGEYNGKFMCNQYVLRGGSCATSSSHIRPTYRNFFPPEARWQFSGIRLAR